MRAVCDSVTVGGFFFPDERFLSEITPTAPGTTCQQAMKGGSPAPLPSSGDEARTDEARSFPLEKSKGVGEQIAQEPATNGGTGALAATGERGAHAVTERPARIAIEVVGSTTLGLVKTPKLDQREDE